VNGGGGSQSKTDFLFAGKTDSREKMFPANAFRFIQRLSPYRISIQTFPLRQPFAQLGGFSQLTIHGVPNWSTNMPKRRAQNVSPIGV
jgi:hypothetical protein